MRRLRDRERGFSLFHLWRPAAAHAREGMRVQEAELFRHYADGVADAVQVFYLLSRNDTDPEYAEVAPCFDAALLCNPLLATQGLWPAIDPLLSRSNFLQPALVGEEHCKVFIRNRTDGCTKLMRAQEWAAATAARHR